MFVFLQLLLYRIFQNFLHSTNGTQDIDDRRSHPIFDTSLVLRNVAQHLPVPDLVNSFSLVNKLWHYEARSCLRNQKSCTLAAGRIHYPEDMEAVLQLCRSNLIPFNRISLNYGDDIEKEQWGTVNFGLIVIIVDAMKLKYLHVKNCKIQLASDSPVSVSTEKLIAHILRSKWKTLEEISFGTIENHRRFGDEQAVPVFGRLPHLLMSQEGFRLPALHSLTFDCRQEGDQQLVSNCVLPILMIAPGLKNLNLEIRRFSLFSPTLLLLPREKFSLLTRFTLYLCRHDSWDSLRFLINNKVACKRLKLTISENYVHSDELPQLMPPFLQRSQKSLTALITDVATIQVLQKAGLLTLPMSNMRYLSLTTGEKHYGIDEWEHIFEMFAGLAKSFPNLRSITLNKGWDSCMYPKAKFNDVLKRSFESARKSEELDWSVKRLIFQNCYSTKTAEFFSILLPKLDHLSLNGPQDKSEYSHILKCWPNLESLEVIENRPNRLEFEAIVCGISESKVCDLRQVTSNQLKQMVIYSSWNSIINGLPNLRSLRVNVAHDQAFKKGLKCPIPHVSKYAAFSRKKNLRVCYQYVPSSVSLGEEESLVY